MQNDDEIRCLFRQMAPLQDITRAARERGGGRDLACAMLREGRERGVSRGYLLKLAKWILFSGNNGGNDTTGGANGEEEGEGELPSVVYEIIAEKFNATRERGKERELPMCKVYYEDTIVVRVLDPYAVDEEEMNSTLAPSSAIIGGHHQIGLRLWPCELFVMEFLHDELFVHNRRTKYFPQLETGVESGGVVLELGAGVGLAGFWCLERGGASRLLLTDFSDTVLENLRVSTGFYDNTPSLKDPTVRRCARVARLDWRTYLDAGETVGEDPMVNATTLVIAADVIYDPNDVDAFLAALVSVMTRTPSCVALVAYTERNSSTFSVFLERLALVNETNPHFRKRVSRICTHKDVPQRYHYRAVHLFDRGDSVRRNEIRLFVIE